MSSAIEVGAEAMRIRLHPYQVELGRMLDGGVETNVIQWPRRMGKTTSVWCWMIGKAIETPGFLVITTAQTRDKARLRWLDAAALLRKGPHCPNIRESNGSERFTWSNDSQLWIVAPKPEAFRSEAADVVYVDEPQELDPEESNDLEQGIMPLLDTRAEGQVILSGTPGDVRAGWFWDSLRHGEASTPGFAMSLHAAAEEDDVNDEAVWQRVHLGIGALTTLDKMRSRHAKMSERQWSMEYMGIWPGSSDNRAISEAHWTAAAVEDDEDWPQIPLRFGLCYDVSPDGSTAALVAAWRDEDGVAYGELLEYGDTHTIGRESLRIGRKFKAAIGYDQIGANLEVAEALSRARPKPKATPLGMRDMMAGAAVLSKLIKTGGFKHRCQPDLDAAAEGVAWRAVGDSGRLFGRRASAGDVTPIVALSGALLLFDRLPVAQETRIVTRVSA